ncbi:hypothetical protein TrVFT333_006882 [Trichoderma virens FT-333]|nr:hypothetical protein TrVFT333_006882 [Trichoderma virens FT-333]
MATAHVSAARYGKDNVRVLKTDRDAVTGIHTVTEMTVSCLLEGDIDVSYTKGDNSVVVATDSIKNTIFITAKLNPVNPRSSSPPSSAPTSSTPTATSTPQTFLRDGQETRNVEARITRKGGIVITSGIEGLTVLKSTGSAFHGFVRDEYTTLAETWDRILSTDVDANWKWKTFADVAAVREVEPKFNAAWEQAREITLTRFAEDESASVQNTMYKMCEQILAAVPETETVIYSLPNKHFFELDLSWHKGIKNTGKDAEVYVPQSNPNGLIKCEVSRGAAASRDSHL